MAFHIQNGSLYCEDLRVEDILGRVSASPFYLYSLQSIVGNCREYTAALGKTRSRALYAVKANGNLEILRRIRAAGLGAVVVSANELRLALEAGFDDQNIVFNGNGKSDADLVLAAETGVLVNIDSDFDLGHLGAAAMATGRTLKLLVRLNPGIDTGVHAYVATGESLSKFGIRREDLPHILDGVRACPLLTLTGVHCHIGSTITDTRVFREAARRAREAFAMVQAAGFDPKYIDLGGGWGIDYEGTGDVPPVENLVAAVHDMLPAGATLLLEPGRSIVGNAGVLVTRVIGVKSNGAARFIVTDGSMTELIRPSLYNAYHRVEFAEPVDGPVHTYDVVGPVCETADFLARSRQLATPNEGAALVVRDVGAYGYAMSSNYNGRPRPPEYLVDGDLLQRIRRGETWDDLRRLFDGDA